MIQTKFILHGGGVKKEDPDFYTEILKDTPENAKILLIFFAKDKDRWAIAEERVKNEFNTVKENKNLSFEVAQESTFIEQMKSVDVVYISGGASKLALDIFKKSPSFGDSCLGKIVSGESAGASILSKFFYSPSANQIFEGFGILPIKVIPHYTEEQKGILDSVGEGLEEVYLPEYTYKVFYK